MISTLTEAEITAATESNFVNMVEERQLFMKLLRAKDRIIKMKDALIAKLRS